MGHGQLGRVRVGLAAVAALAATGACSSSPPTPTPAASTSTSASSTTSTTSTTSSPTSTSRPTTSSGTSTTPAGTAECKAGVGKATVVTASGGASAGHVQLQVQVTNASSKPCTIKGYPGVSLVTGTEGAQLGAPAQRVAGPEGLVTLQPGGKATAQLSLTQAANVPDCGVTAAAGFRVYLPDDTAAQFAPLAQQGCSNAKVVLLEVSPFTA